MRKFLSLILVAIIFLGGQVATASTYKTCSQLLKVHRYGIAQSSVSAKSQSKIFFIPKVSKSLYLSNKRLDTDRDGVACEVKRPSAGKPPVETVSAGPVPGRLCSTPNETKNVFDQKFTCINISGQNRWSVGTLDKEYQYSTDDGYLHARSEYCAIDKLAGAEWAGLQAFIQYEVRSCSGPMRILNYKMGNGAPTTPSSIQPENASPCKASSVSNNWIKGFGSYRRNVLDNILGRQSVIQIIPIYSSDTALPSKTPQEDYAKYFEFVKSFVNSISDGPVSFEIRVPQEYIEFNKPLKNFGISHVLQGPHPTALSEIMQVVDSKINFTGATTALVLVPPGTAHDVWEQGPLGAYQTNEGWINGASSQYPATEKLSGPRPNFVNLSTPAWWVHEFYHLGVGLDDPYGDGQRNPTTITGMGWWGLMSPALTDLLGWHKWILSYTQDSQVVCINPAEKTSTLWLRPNSVKTDQIKLGVIPIDSQRVIVFESIRGAGMNISLKGDEQGLLVYKVDTTNQLHGYGFDVQYPAARASRISGTFPGSRAPLKLGEKVTVEGYSIEVVESGNYGDVVRVTRN